MILFSMCVKQDNATTIFQICQGGHQLYKWCSQPILNRRLHSGDLLLSASVLLSGNNFTKVALFAKFMKLHFVSAPVYLRIQRTYLVPTIDNFWREKQRELLAELEDEELVLLGNFSLKFDQQISRNCSI